MTDSLNLSRKQLAQFLPTQELIRTFERLLHTVSSLSPESYDNLIAQIDSINNQLLTLNNSIDNLESSISITSSGIDSLVDLIEPQIPYNDVWIKNKFDSLGSGSETDPVFSASAAASITTTNISNWNSAFSWGDHSAAGYASYINGALIAGDTSYGTWPTFRPRLILKNNDPNYTGRTAAVIQSTNTSSAAMLAMLNSNNTKRLYLMMSNSAYPIANWGAMVTEGGTPFNFVTDGDMSSGGTSNIYFYLGGYQSPAHVLTLDYRKRLGLNVINPSYDFSFNGNSAVVFAMERHTTANTAGNSLTIAAGACTIGATDKNGGTQIISGGIATGSGESGVQIKTAKSGASGTADRTPTTIIEALGDKLAFNGATPVNKPNVTGSRGANAALASLLTALAQLGLVTDSTTV